MMPIGSVRLRIAVGATVIVGLVLALAAFALTRLHRDSLIDSVDTTLNLRADDIEPLLEGGNLRAAMSVSDDEVAAVQLVDGNGRVLAASENLSGHPDPIVSTVQPGEIAAVGGLPFEDEPFRVLVRPVEYQDTGAYLLVAASTDDIDDSAGVLRLLLLLGIPPITVAAAVGAWLLAGQALAPIEAIRREVATISDSDLSRRAPRLRGNDEVARLARTMNGMLDRIDAAYQAQSQFVADAAHELRSPLASVRAQLEAEGELRADLEAELSRMERLVDDLLVLASSGTPAAEVALRPLDFEDIVLAEARRATRRGPHAVDDSEVHPAAVRGDPEGLARVIRNLVENAEGYARGRVAVGLVAADGRVILTVDDDGPGVPDADREHVFDRFRRSDAGRARRTGGTGLGLAIVKEVVERHGGRTWVERAPIGGARFVVELREA